MQGSSRGLRLVKKSQTLSETKYTTDSNHTIDPIQHSLNTNLYLKGNETIPTSPKRHLNSISYITKDVEGKLPIIKENHYFHSPKKILPKEFEYDDDLIVNVTSSSIHTGKGVLKSHQDGNINSKHVSFMLSPKKVKNVVFIDTRKSEDSILTPMTPINSSSTNTKSPLTTLNFDINNTPNAKPSQISRYFHFHKTIRDIYYSPSKKQENDLSPVILNEVFTSPKRSTIIHNNKSINSSSSLISPTHIHSTSTNINNIPILSSPPRNSSSSSLSTVQEKINQINSITLNMIPINIPSIQSNHDNSSIQVHEVQKKISLPSEILIKSKEENKDQTIQKNQELNISLSNQSTILSTEKTNQILNSNDIKQNQNKVDSNISNNLYNVFSTIMKKNHHIMESIEDTKNLSPSLQELKQTPIKSSKSSIPLIMYTNYSPHSFSECPKDIFINTVEPSCSSFSNVIIQPNIIHKESQSLVEKPSNISNSNINTLSNSIPVNENNQQIDINKNSQDIDIVSKDIQKKIKDDHELSLTSDNIQISNSKSKESPLYSQMNILEHTDISKSTIPEELKESVDIIPQIQENSIENSTENYASTSTDLKLHDDSKSENKLSNPSVEQLTNQNIEYSTISKLEHENNHPQLSSPKQINLKSTSYSNILSSTNTISNTTISSPSNHQNLKQIDTQLESRIMKLKNKVNRELNNKNSDISIIQRAYSSTQRNIDYIDKKYKIENDDLFFSPVKRLFTDEETPNHSKSLKHSNKGDTNLDIELQHDISNQNHIISDINYKSTVDIHSSLDTPIIPIQIVSQNKQVDSSTNKLNSKDQLDLDISTNSSKFDSLSKSNIMLISNQQQNIENDKEKRVTNSLQESNTQNIASQLLLTHSENEINNLDHQSIYKVILDNKKDTSINPKEIKETIEIDHSSNEHKNKNIEEKSLLTMNITNVPKGYSDIKSTNHDTLSDSQIRFISNTSNFPNQDISNPSSSLLPISTTEFISTFPSNNSTSSSSSPIKEHKLQDNYNIITASSISSENPTILNQKKYDFKEVLKNEIISTNLELRNHRKSASFDNTLLPSTILTLNSSDTDTIPKRHYHKIQFKTNSYSKLEDQLKNRKQNHTIKSNESNPTNRRRQSFSWINSSNKTNINQSNTKVNQNSNKNTWLPILNTSQLDIIQKSKDSVKSSTLTYNTTTKRESPYHKNISVSSQEFNNSFIKQEDNISKGSIPNTKNIKKSKSSNKYINHPNVTVKKMQKQKEVIHAFVKDKDNHFIHSSISNSKSKNEFNEKSIVGASSWLKYLKNFFTSKKS